MKLTITVQCWKLEQVKEISIKINAISNTAALHVLCSGAGGKEAALFTAEMFLMYRKYVPYHMEGVGCC